MAIDLLDESDLRLGSAVPGKMRVREADRASKYHTDDRAQEANRKVLSKADRRKMAKKREEMNKYIRFSTLASAPH